MCTYTWVSLSRTSASPTLSICSNWWHPHFITAEGHLSVSRYALQWEVCVRACVLKGVCFQRRLTSSSSSLTRSGQRSRYKWRPRRKEGWKDKLWEEAADWLEARCVIRPINNKVTADAEPPSRLLRIRDLTRDFMTFSYFFLTLLFGFNVDLEAGFMFLTPGQSPTFSVSSLSTCQYVVVIFYNQKPKIFPGDA